MSASKIKDRYGDAAIEKCRDGGCSLRINRKKSFVVLKGERLVSQRKICDCIIFQDKNIIMAELKSKSMNVPDTVEQLTNGGEKALDIAAETGMGNPRLYFALLAREYRPSQAAWIAQKSVKIRKKSYRIVLCRCGDSIDKVLNRKSS